MAGHGWHVGVEKRSESIIIYIVSSSNRYMNGFGIRLAFKKGFLFGFLRELSR